MQGKHRGGRQRGIDTQIELESSDFNVRKIKPPDDDELPNSY
jgi:hypothetical protein